MHTNKGTFYLEGAALTLRGRAGPKSEVLSSWTWPNWMFFFCKTLHILFLESKFGGKSIMILHVFSIGTQKTC